jgi:hypothetical protein
MANENVTQPVPAELFTMDGTYLIGADCTPGQLMNDSSCFMASALGVLEEKTGDLSNGQWAALYLLRQAKGMHDQAQSMLIQSGAIDS